MKDLYIASCTKEDGIYHYKMDDAGKTIFCDKTLIDSPMYMVREKNTMYVILKSYFEDKTSALVSFKIDDDGKLYDMSEPVSTKGLVACHLTVDNGAVYAVNYSSGSVFKNPDTLVVHKGVLGPNAKRQEMPHTHFVGITPDGEYVCVTDLGLDTIFFYDKDLNEKFSVKVPAGHGARHIVFSEDGKYMYCANELASTVSVFEYNKEDTKLLKTYETLPADFDGINLAAAIRLDNGYLYVSNRGYDGVTSFKVDGENLELTGYFKLGAHPRDINIFGDILVSTNMHDNTVTFYKINDGKIEKTDNIIEEINEPLCVM